MRFVALALVACAVACTPGTRPRQSLVTVAEQSRFVRTGRFQEVLDLCVAFEQSYAAAHCDTLGLTAEDRTIVALRIAKHPGLPYVYIQGGVHAGEIEGKDAGFWFVRDLLDGKVAPGALDKVSILFVPAINVDGHERFGKNQRPNQRGPEEMGFRVTAQRWNLNRDWLKADSPEVRAVLRMFDEYDPLLFIDLHTTDGAKFETDISVTMAPVAPRPDQLEETATALSAVVMSRLTALGHLPVDFYPSFIDEQQPESGFSRGEAPVRFASSYMAARNRIGVLVETHSWRTYKERVLSTYHTLQALLEEATRSAGPWRAVMSATDAAMLAGTEVPLTWKTDETSHDIAFRGYAYERRLSELTGGTWLVYDEATPEIWTLPLFDHLVPNVTVTAPTAGYYVDGGFAKAVADVLDRHGIRYARVPAAAHGVEVFRAEPSTVEPNTIRYRLPLAGAILEEGRTKIPFTGAWAPETRTLDQGSLFVPIAQPKARLVLQLLEPSGPDSLAAQGVFNICFEQKEYAEEYVLEQAAREMFAADPVLAAEFAAYVASAPTLEQKLSWLHRHHPSWDERLGLFPVYRAR